MSYAEAVLGPSLVIRSTLSLLYAYQGVNRNDRFIQSSPNKNLSFTVLTGQSSSSQWAIEQVQNNQADTLSSLATVGVALLFSADAFFNFVNNTLIVSHPHMPDFVNLNLVEGDSTIELVREPSLAEALKIFGKGSIHMGLAIIRYFANKYPGLPKGEIISEKKGEVVVRITDTPAKPDNSWGGGGGKPAETHDETRVEFKGHYKYRIEDVERGKDMWE